jgi:hypothetical protein
MQNVIKYAFVHRPTSGDWNFHVNASPRVNSLKVSMQNVQQERVPLHLFNQYFLFGSVDHQITNLRTGDDKWFQIVARNGQTETFLTKSTQIHWNFAIAPQPP